MDKHGEYWNLFVFYKTKTPYLPPTLFFFLGKPKPKQDKEVYVVPEINRQFRRDIKP